MKSETEKLVSEIQNFLGKEKIVNEDVAQEEASRCRYALPLDFKCIEFYNTCKSERRRAEAPDAPIKCDFPDYQSECLYYKPDPDESIRRQFWQSFKQLEDEIKRLKIEYEKTDEREPLEKTIRAMRELIKLIKRGMSIGGLFAGIPNFTLMAHDIQLKNLEEELKRHKESHRSPWYKVFGK